MIKMELKGLDKFEKGLKRMQKEFEKLDGTSEVVTGRTKAEAVRNVKKMAKMKLKRILKKSFK
jgi:hypothetical protein